MLTQNSLSGPSHIPDPFEDGPPSEVLVSLPAGSANVRLLAALEQVLGMSEFRGTNKHRMLEYLTERARDHPLAF